VVVGRAFACTAYCELPYSVFSSSSLSSHAWWQICGPEVVRNSIIALLSQAKQSIIGARFSPTNLLLFRRTGSLDRLDRKPATIFQFHQQCHANAAPVNEQSSSFSLFLLFLLPFFGRLSAACCSAEGACFHFSLEPCSVCL
jgi:hypothetical protein